MKRIIIDTQGADRPEELILGALDLLGDRSDFSVLFAGYKETVDRVLEKEKPQQSILQRIDVLDAREEITNDDSPARAILQKKDSALVKALNALKNGEGMGLISAGNTGAVLAGASIIVGCKEGIERPTLASPLPNAAGTVTMLLDCGANVDCTPERLLEFALLGNDAYKKIYHKEEPTVGLLSVGTEEHKGNKLTKGAYPLLSNAAIRFVGNVEARDVFSGKYDVMVCDGFVGNMILKSLEGCALHVLSLASKKMKELFVSPDEKAKSKELTSYLLSSVDLNSMGGALLLGIKRPIVKIHGAANRKTLPAAALQLLYL